MSKKAKEQENEIVLDSESEVKWWLECLEAACTLAATEHDECVGETPAEIADRLYDELLDRMSEKVRPK